MDDRRSRGTLRRRLAALLLMVSGSSLAVLFVGTVVPHLMVEDPDLGEAISPQWLLAATVAAMSTALVVSAVLASRLTRPIQDYIDTARRFAAGDHSARPAEVGVPELADLTRAFTAAVEEIERTERVRAQLTADIAHELRTPLAALQAGLEELRDGLVPADRATLAALHDQACRLGRIVNDLSELSAAENSGIRVRLEAVDLASVAELALAARTSSMLLAGLEIECDLQRDVTVIADADRMHQVVTNLLTNTVLYCRPGDRVTVRVRALPGWGVLQVCDTGPGFRADELPNVFNRAWRGASADGTRGSGLGLPIVKVLVEAQGGTVDVDSAGGRGATISVRLPLAPSAADVGRGRSG